jgi:uncharacterized protein (TIGR02996 family)
MPDEAAFLAAIAADLADDAPRLVYADWLDEQGRCEQAEFIRVSIACSLVPRRRRDKIERLQAEEAEGATTLSEAYDAEDLKALELFRREWPLAAWMRDHAVPAGWTLGADFHRGFLMDLICQWKYWLPVADEAKARHPALRRVTLEDWPGPEFDLQNDFVSEVRLGILGRGRFHALPFQPGELLSHLMRRVCQAEWPGIAFVMGRMEQAVWGRSPISAAWEDTPSSIMEDLRRIRDRFEQDELSRAIISRFAMPDAPIVRPPD